MYSKYFIRWVILCSIVISNYHWTTKSNNTNMLNKAFNLSDLSQATYTYVHTD
jgi:hypothetical protein